MLVKDFLRKTPIEGDLGIEVEVEASEDLPRVVPDPWVAKPDGSLRGKKFNRESRTDTSSMEYVTNGCISAGVGKHGKIKALCQELAKSKYGVDADSARTSVHVHVNVAKLSLLQLWTAVFSYWIVEDALIEYCGEERKGNMYCLRLRDAEGVLRTVESCLTMYKGPLTLLETDSIRYCAINLKSVPTLGSLEFRAMRGTIDEDVIDNWSTMVYDVVHKSSRWSNPAEALDYFWEQGPNNFLSALTNFSNFAILSKSKNWKELAADNAATISDVVYSTDWHKYVKAVEDSSKKKSARRKTLTDAMLDAPVAVPRTRRTTRIGAPRWP